MSKLVKAPLVIAKREDGSDVYVYEGSPLPDGLAEGEADRLADFLADEDETSKKKPAAKKSAASK